MKRLSAYFAALSLAIFATSAMAQDKVIYLDRSGKTATTMTRSGKITAEDPGKVLCTGTDEKRYDIPVNDIIDVQYDGEPLTELRAAREAEAGRKLDAALAGYSDALKKAGNNVNLKRHLEYKVAEMRVAQADAGGPNKPALDALRAFFTLHPEGRQATSCMEQLGRLLASDGQSVAEVIDGLTKIRDKFGNDNQPLAARCDQLRADLSMIELETSFYKEGPDAAKKKAPTISTRLQAVIKTAPQAVVDDVQSKVLLCEALVKGDAELAKFEAMTKTGSERAKAAAHLARGDYYRWNKKLKEAMWDYLWVDTIHNQDRDHHAKALYYLNDIFEKLGDSAKARDCKDRLTTDARLKESRYQKMMQK